MPILDITLSISPDLPVWPGDPAIHLERVASIEAGANANVSHLALGVHTGTHLDAPVHFVPGAAGIETLALETLIGRAYVLYLPAVERQITAADLQSAGIPAGTQRLLCRTRNSEFWARGETQFQTDFVGLGAEAAAWVVEHGIKLVGADYLSVSPWKQSRPTHEILLKAGVIIVEGLNLTGVAPGEYDFICLPLKLPGSDGAPARAVLITP